MSEVMKKDDGKNRTDLLPVYPLQEIAKVLTFGAKKYAPQRWRKGMEWNRPYGAALRHLFAWQDGQDTDPETGLSHLAHAATNLMFLLEYGRTGAGTDDRPAKLKGVAGPGIPFVEDGGVYKCRNGSYILLLDERCWDKVQVKQGAARKLLGNGVGIGWNPVGNYGEKGQHYHGGDRSYRCESTDLVEKIGKV